MIWGKSKGFVLNIFIIQLHKWGIALNMQKKKKQHFVWKHYLRKWARNEIIFCLMGEKILEVNLVNIGHENYFYKLKELTDKEIILLKAIIEKIDSPFIKELSHSWIDLFNNIFALKKRIDGQGNSNPEIDEMFDVLICNFEEDIHCKIESEGIDLLELLYNKDLSFYDDDERLITFLFFICQQYFRTQNSSANVKNGLEAFKGLNIDAMWAVLRHIFSTTVGATLYAKRDKFRPIIIENKSDLPFVTGDQPVINTYAVGLNLEEMPKELEFYYPLTPALALLLTSKEEYRTQTIIPASKSDVMKYNRFIHDQSGKQLYASSRDVLERMLSE